jgi:hypothetical protein
MDFLVVLITNAIVGSVSSILLERLSREKKSKKESVEERINKLTYSLRESSALVGQIESEIQERSALVQKLKNDAETYEQIAKLKASEVEAVAQLFRGELKKEGQRSFWQSVGMNFLFYVLGAITSIGIGIMLK